MKKVQSEKEKNEKKKNEKVEKKKVKVLHVNTDAFRVRPQSFCSHSPSELRRIGISALRRRKDPVLTISGILKNK
jgi:hypothetical protein